MPAKTKAKPKQKSAFGRNPPPRVDIGHRGSPEYQFDDPLSNLLATLLPGQISQPWDGVEFDEDFSDSEADAGVQLESKDTLVQRHNEFRSQAMAMSGGKTFIRPHYAARRAKLTEIAACIPLSECHPILVRDLQPETTHRGRILRGRLIVEAFFHGRVYSVLEDEVGDAVCIGFDWGYDLPHRSHETDHDFAQRMYPKGSEVTVWEPYYKLAMSGCMVVMVSDPEKDVTFATKLPTDSASKWALKGQQGVASHDFASAIDCYSNAVNLLASRCNICLAFQGLCNSLQRTQEHAASLQAAVAALAIADDKWTGKAWCIAAATLNGLQESKAAGYCYAKAKQCKAKKVDLKKLASLDFEKVEPDCPQGENALLLAIANYCCRPLRIPVAKTPGVEEFEKWMAAAEKSISSNRHQNAVDAFMDALAAVRPTLCELAHVLLCRASCKGKVGDSPKLSILIDLIGAITLDPKTEMYHCEYVDFLRSLSLLREARKSATLGMENVERCDVLRAKRRQIQALIGNSSEVRETRKLNGNPGFYGAFLGKPGEKVAGYMTKRLSIQVHNDQVHFLAKFPKTLWPYYTECWTGDALQEYSQGPGAEVGCNPDICNAYLFLCEHSTRKLKTWTNAYSLPEHGAEVHFGRWSVEDLEKRLKVGKKLSAKKSEIFEWFKSAKMGNVRFWRIENFEENENEKINYFFNPVPTQSNVMRPGINISIDFPDLSELLWADFSRGSAESQIAFYGFSTSRYCFAKSLVIAEMLENKSVEAQEIVEVWFSSVWSRQSLEDFRTAVSGVLSDPVLFGGDAVIKSIMNAWLSTDVNLREAREGWLMTRAQPQGEATCNFARIEDRLALCAYEVAGEVNRRQANERFGSVTMFTLPEGMRGCVHENCHFLQSLPREPFSKEYGTLPLYGKKESVSIVYSGAAILEAKIEELQKAVQTGKMTIELKFVENFKAAFEAVMELDEKPAFVNWNRMVDKIPVAQFQELSHRIASASTVQAGHSVHWLSEVKGSNILDQMTRGNAEAQKRAFYNSHYAAVKSCQRFFAKTGLNGGRYQPHPALDPTKIQTLLPNHDPGDFVYFDLIGPPTLFASMPNREIYSKTWAAKFFDGQPVIWQAELEQYFPVYSGSDHGTLYMQWKYM